MTKSRLLDSLIFVLYLGLSAFMMLHHEPWRDEAQTWLIARDVPWLGILKEAMYQRHPALWYYMLAPLAKSGLPYLSQFILHLSLAVSAVFLLLFFCPLPRLAKYLFIFGYYMCNEYVIIARHYVLGALFLFAVATVWPSRHKRPLLFGLLVFMLFNSTYLCFIGAGAIILLYLYELYEEKDWAPRKLGAIFLMGLGALSSFAQGFLLPADHSDKGTHLVFEIAQPFFVLRKALFPLGFDISVETSTVIAILVFLGIFLYLAQNKKILFLTSFFYGGLLYILCFRHPGNTRHYGFALIFVLFLLWIQKTTYFKKDISLQKFPSLQNAVSKYVYYAFFLLFFSLVVSVRYAAIANVKEYSAQFSGGQQMAREIQRIESDYLHTEMSVIAHPSTKASAVLPYFKNKQFWYPDIQKWGTYCHYTNAQFEGNTISDLQALERANNNFKSLAGFFYLASSPISFQESLGYRFVPVAAAYENIFGFDYERFYLYRIIPLIA